MISERVAKISISKTMEITALADELKKQGKDIVAFTAGQPDFDTPQHIKEAAVTAIIDRKTKYTAAEGIVELREAIAKKLKKDNNLDYNKDEIVVSCGAKHSLYNIMQAILNPGDEVIIPVPYWVTFPEQVKLADGVPVFVECNDDCMINIDNIKKKISDKTKAIVINSPNNPTGQVFDEKSLKQVAELAVKNNIYIISDECYEKLVYEGSHTSIASLGEEIKNKTITVNAVSKTYSMTGWRIGYCTGPKDVIDAIKNIQSHMTSNPTSIAQYAALAALTGNDDFLKGWVKEYDERRKYMVKKLNKIKGITCFEPKGAFYCFADISQLNHDSLEFCKNLLEEKDVAVIPGVAFGRDGHIRLSYATSMDQIEKGLNRLEEFCNSCN